MSRATTSGCTVPQGTDGHGGRVDVLELDGPIETTSSKCGGGRKTDNDGKTPRQATGPGGRSVSACRERGCQARNEAADPRSTGCWLPRRSPDSPPGRNRRSSFAKVVKMTREGTRSRQTWLTPRAHNGRRSRFTKDLAEPASDPRGRAAAGGSFAFRGRYAETSRPRAGSRRRFPLDRPGCTSHVIQYSFDGWRWHRAQRAGLDPLRLRPVAVDGVA